MEKGHTIPIYGGQGYISLVDYHGDDLRAVNAARVSFGRESQELDERDIKLLGYLAEHGHTSPFEHSSVTLKAKVPLFVARQWMRHRTLSYNEISRRYTAENIEFWYPEKLRAQAPVNRQASVDTLEGGIQEHAARIYAEAVEHADLAYQLLLQIGVCREHARAVLPAALFTEFYLSGNLLNLLRFVTIRTHEGAQAEMVEAAQAVKVVLAALFPHTVELWNK